MVAQYYARPYPTTATTIGSFMTMVTVLLARDNNCVTATSRSSLLSKRVTSLFYDEVYQSMLLLPTSSQIAGSRELFHQLQEYESDRYMSSIALQLYNYIQMRYRYSDTSDSTNSRNMDHSNSEDDIEMHASSVFALLVGRMNYTLMDDTKSNDVILDNGDLLLNENDRRSIISYLVKIVRSNFGNITTNSVLTQLHLFDDEKIHYQKGLHNRMKYKINELIVLLDHCITLHDIHRCIDSMLSMNREKEGSDEQIYPFGDNNSSMYVPCPRRDHVRALMREIDNSEIDTIGNKDDNNNKKTLLLINVPGIMYRLIRNRVVVTEVEWYEALLDHVRNNYIAPTSEYAEMTDWFHIFACGIRQLQLSGLIRRNEGRNNAIQYERIALVWCGGD
jgi:hypothetical protein